MLEVVIKLQIHLFCKLSMTNCDCVVIVASLSINSNKVTNHKGVVYAARLLEIIWIVASSITNAIYTTLSLIDSMD